MWYHKILNYYNNDSIHAPVTSQRLLLFQSEYKDTIQTWTVTDYSIPERKQSVIIYHDIFVIILYFPFVA